MTVKITHYMRRSRPGDFSIERLFLDLRSALSEDMAVRVWQPKRVSAGIWNRAWSMVDAVWFQGDVNHITGDVHFLSILLRKGRNILTIHDIGSLHRTSGFRRFIIWLFWYYLPINRSKFVTVISAWTKKEILTYVRCSPEKIIVVPNFVSEEFKPSPKIFDTTCPKILHLGTKENKNLRRTIRALAGLECSLTIIGDLDEVDKELLSESGVQYENLSKVGRDRVLEAYQSSDLLLFASTYEGFGLPILEAQAVGRAVITSSAASMPEVAGDGAHFVDPYDVQDIRDAVVRISLDAAYREDLIKKGFENVKRFKLDVIASEYARLYRAICDAEDSPIVFQSGRPS